MCSAVWVQLSPEVTDLLNKIFVVDEKKRITINDIKKHPWYHIELPKKYADALKDIHERQRRVEEYIKRRDLNIVRAYSPFYSLTLVVLSPFRLLQHFCAEVVVGWTLVMHGGGNPENMT